MMKKLIITIICMCVTLTMHAQQAKSVKNIEAAKLEKKIKKNIQLVDVRTPKEFSVGHIGNAVNIDVNDPNFEAKIQALNKKKRVYVYCRTGRKSVIATNKMDSLGFKKVYNLPQGIEGWNKEKNQLN